MASCGPPPRAAATPAAAAVTAAARAAATPGAAEIHATATPSIEQRYRQYKQLYFGGGFPRYSSSCPHPRFDIDTHETSLQLSVRRCPLSGPTSRSCTGGSIRGTNKGKNVVLPASPRRQGVSSAHPQRYQAFDSTSAQGIMNLLRSRPLRRTCSAYRPTSQVVS